MLALARNVKALTKLPLYLNANQLHHLKLLSVDAVFKVFLLGNVTKKGFFRNTIVKVELGVKINKLVYFRNAV